MAGNKSFFALRGSSTGPFVLVSPHRRKALHIHHYSEVFVVSVQYPGTKELRRAAIWWAQLNYAEVRIKQLELNAKNAFLQLYSGACSSPSCLDHRTLYGFFFLLFLYLNSLLHWVLFLHHSNNKLYRTSKIITFSEPYWCYNWFLSPTGRELLLVHPTLPTSSSPAS